MQINTPALPLAWENGVIIFYDEQQRWWIFEIDARFGNTLRFSTKYSPSFKNVLFFWKENTSLEQLFCRWLVFLLELYNWRGNLRLEM